jgi:hypothetical protein
MPFYPAQPFSSLTLLICFSNSAVRDVLRRHLKASPNSPLSKKVRRTPFQMIASGGASLKKLPKGFHALMEASSAMLCTFIDFDL